MKRILSTTLLFVSFLSANAFSDTLDIPIFRQSRHDDIKQEQINCDKLDGKVDGMLNAGNNETVNAQITDALFRKINEFRNWIESNNAQIASNNDKVKYLKYVADLLVYFRVNKRERSIKIEDLPDLLKTAESIMKAKAEDKTILTYIDGATYPIARICSQIFADGAEKKEASKIVYLKQITLFPDKILQTITPYCEEPFADILMP
jgi:hypothetical protein